MTTLSAKAALEMLAVLQIIARGACLEQVTGDKCICYSCLAREVIAKVA